MTANTVNYEDQGGAGTHIGGTLTIESGGTFNIAAGAIFQQGGIAYDRMIKVAKVALGALDTAGGVLAWLNPHAASILVTRLIVYTSTKSTGASTTDFGVAANGTTSNDGLIDGLDTGTAAGVFDNTINHGTNGKAGAIVASGSYVTGSMASGAEAGLVGFAYIHYYLI